MSDTELNLVNQLAEEFLDRLRKGEQPSIVEYATRFPEHADQIRELFPALRMLEKSIPVPSKLTSEPVRAELQLPCQLGDYRVIREVARGGMGIVYEAEQQALGRMVALKVLSAASAKKRRSLARFQLEARSAGRLHHTNIVPVHDIGCVDGIHFYTMQLIDGESLDHVVTELSQLRKLHSQSTTEHDRDIELSTDVAAKPNRIARMLLTEEFSSFDSGSFRSNSDSSKMASTAVADALPRKQGSFTSSSSNHPWTLLIGNVARIGLQIADALAYAHGQKILHRDIKPSNLLLDVHGNVWVTDFGLAREDDEALTVTGELVGTFRYMAPERFRGVADARCDIYSLGLTLYELLTLRSCLPRSDRLSNLRLDAPRDIPPPRQCNPSIPADLETIVLKAIEHDPHQRYASAEDLAEDLRRFLTDRPILARPFTRLERSWMWVRRNPRESTWVAFLALALVTLGLGGLFTFFMRNERDRARQAEQAAILAEHAATLAERESQVRSLLARAIAERQSERPDARQRALTHIRQAVELTPSDELSESLRDEAIAAMAMADVRIENVRIDEILPKEYRDHPAEPDWSYIAGVSQNGEHFVISLSKSGEAVIVDRKGDRPPRELSLSPEVTKVSFSDSGAMILALGDAGRVGSLWNSTTGERIFEIPKYYGMALSPDERRLAFGLNDHTIRLVDLNKPDQFRTISTEQISQAISFSPDGSSLAVCFADRASVVSIYDVVEGRLTHQLSCGGSLGIDWHPNGKQLAICLWNRIEVWDVGKEEMVVSTGALSHRPWECSISHDGRLLLASGWDGASRLWDLNSMRLLLTLESQLFEAWDGRSGFLGYRQNVLKSGIELVHVAGSPILRTLPSSRLQEEASGLVRFSPNSDLALSLMASINMTGVGRRIDICNVTTGKLAGTLGADKIHDFNIDHEGRWLDLIHGQQWSRLPIENVSPKVMKLGPPQSHSLPDIPVRSAISGDQSNRVVLTRNKLLVLRWEPSISRDGQHAPLTTVHSLKLPYRHDQIAISHDGKWAATAYWHSDIVCVWDLVEGKLLKELNVGHYNRVYFSPAASQLVISRADAYRFFDLPTMANTFTLNRIDCPQPDPIAIDPSGRLAVVCLQSTELALVDLRTQSPIARLRRPHQHRPSNLAFNRDGTAILEGNGNDTLVAVWDLRSLHRELKAIGLNLFDWDLPPGEASSSLEEVIVEGVDSWSRPGVIGLQPIELARKHIESLHRILESNPKSANDANNLSWTLSMAPEALRNVDRAVELAEQAVAADASTTHRNTLALAYYRAGKFEAAIAELNKNVLDSKDSELPWDLFILSMCHAALGNTTLASEHFRMGERWMLIKDGGNYLVAPSEMPELKFLRDEAATALAKALK